MTKQTKKGDGFTVKIVFTETSPYYKSGEETREVKNITEIHYSYPSPLNREATAFESDIEGTGFTILNEYIKEFEAIYQSSPTKGRIK
jgi:hypothetical protein